jgi:hypothetical protein
MESFASIFKNDFVRVRGMSDWSVATQARDGLQITLAKKRYRTTMILSIRPML